MNVVWHAKTLSQMAAFLYTDQLDIATPIPPYSVLILWY